MASRPAPARLHMWTTAEGGANSAMTCRQAPQGGRISSVSPMTRISRISRSPAATMAKMALRSAQQVSPNEEFSTLQPLIDPAVGAEDGRADAEIRIGGVGLFARLPGRGQQFLFMIGHVPPAPAERAASVNCRFAAGINQGNTPEERLTDLDFIRPRNLCLSKAISDDPAVERRRSAANRSWTKEHENSPISDGGPAQGRDRDVRILPGEALPRGLPGRRLPGRLHHGRARRRPLRLSPAPRR